MIVRLTPLPRMQHTMIKIIKWFGKWTIVTKELIEHRINLIKTLEQKHIDNSVIYGECLIEKQRLTKLLETDELEEYWNTRRPTVHWQHRARNGEWIDPRYFLSKDSTVPSMKHLKSNDRKAIAALNLVRNEIKYVGEKKEFWKFSYETWRDKFGDCEDGAILMYNIMLNSGIPHWRIRLNCGDVMGGGHAYVTYLKEKDDEWYVLDWCYWYNPNGVKWKNAHKYYSDSDGKKGFNIWSSLNPEDIFGDLPKEK